jgi:hypothetical protein
MISDLFSVIAPKVAAPLRAGEYQTLMADPPWLERGGGQIKRGADRHYPLMSTRDICLLPVRQWAGPNAHLYLWVTNNFLPDGLEVMAAWGFRYVTKIDWFKSSDPNDAIAEGSALDAADRDLQIGLGQYFRGCTEASARKDGQDSTRRENSTPASPRRCARWWNWSALVRTLNSLRVGQRRAGTCGATKRHEEHHDRLAPGAESSTCQAGIPDAPGRAGLSGTSSRDRSPDAVPVARTAGVRVAL